MSNNPLRYTDPTGHFTCQNNSTSFTGNCKEIIESYLSILESKGGKEGKALVEAFREADTVTHYNRGGGYEEQDQIAITIGTDDGSGGGAYLGGLEFSLSDTILTNLNETDTLVHAGQLGHEIVHLTQADILDRVLGISSGSLHDEIEAYDVQSKIYESMGLSPDQNGTVEFAAEIASYKDASEKSILSSRWARSNYRAFPLHDGGNRQFDDWWYLDN